MLQADKESAMPYRLCVGTFTRMCTAQGCAVDAEHSACSVISTKPDGWCLLKHVQTECAGQQAVTKLT